MKKTTSSLLALILSLVTALGAVPADAALARFAVPEPELSAALAAVDLKSVIGVSLDGPLAQAPLAQFLPVDFAAVHKEPSPARDEALRQAFAQARLALQAQAEGVIERTAAPGGLELSQLPPAASDLDLLSGAYQSYLLGSQRKAVARNKPKVRESLARKLGSAIAAERFGDAQPAERPSVVAVSEPAARKQPGRGTQDFALIGVGIMGKGFVMNAAEHGVSMAVYDAFADLKPFVDGEAKDLDVVAAKDMAELVASLKRPRKIMLLVPDGKPVAGVLKTLSGLLEPGDIVIESGNSRFRDSDRRERQLKRKGILFVPMGISGGERGARRGPSLMPGGDPKAYSQVRGILQAVAGRAHDGEPAMGWMGRGGAGHYVKMVHNGIEYAEIDYLSEIYSLFLASGYDNDQIAEVFERWNGGENESFLLGVGVKVLRKIDEKTGRHLVDKIRDTAKQKGTGKWTQLESLETGAGSPTLSAAVEDRTLSSFSEKRRELSQRLQGPTPRALSAAERARLEAAAEQALYAGRIIAFDQGLRVLKQAPAKYGLDLGVITRAWRAGCILQGRLVNLLAEEYRANPGLDWVLSDPRMQAALNANQQGLRELSKRAIEQGVSSAAFDSARSYYDKLRSAKSPANFIQAERDYFGSHRFERIDAPAGETFHEPTWENGPQTKAIPPPAAAKKSFHLVVQGAGDVVQKYYSPALKDLMEKYSPTTALKVTFIDSSAFWKSDPVRRAKMEAIIADIKAWGAEYVDLAEAAGKAAFEALKPDALVIATPDTSHVDIANSWLSRAVPPGKVFIEKPLDANRDKANDLVNRVGFDDPNVRILDHYEGRISPTPGQLDTIDHHLGGGIESFEYYFVEDHSADDPNYKTLAKRDGAIEQEQRVGALNNGMVMDGLNHLAPPLQLFADLTRIRVTGVRAAQYTGVDGDPDKRTEIKGETFAEVRLQTYRKPIRSGQIVSGDGLITGVAYMGKGVKGSKALGPGYDRNMKMFRVVGLNGNVLELDLRSDSADGRHAQARLIDKDGSLTTVFPLYAKPYRVFFEKIIDGQTPGLSIEIGERMLELMERVVRPIRSAGALPIYPGGMSNRPSLLIEEIQELVPYLFHHGSVKETGPLPH